MSKSQKGGQWERDISRYFSKWLTGQQKELYFWRSPSSGGMFTRSPDNTTISGDIIAIKPEADILCSKFSLELKIGYKEASLDKHLKSNKSDPLKSFWIQAVDDAYQADKLPLLIYKKLGLKTPWLGIEPIFYQQVSNYLEKLRFIHLRWDIDYPDTYFFELYEFFDIITPEIIKNIK